MFAVYDICEDRWVGFVTETFCDGHLTVIFVFVVGATY